ncbi:MAG: hypothetical protein E7K48_03730 [Varibaculum cambriense]|nr:hypothetical protein [Varibaculum cambriense]
MHYPPRSSNREQRAARAAQANPKPAAPATPTRQATPATPAPPPTLATPAKQGNGKDQQQPKFDLVTAIGELIVIAGIFVAAFTLWNLFVTDMQAEKTQLKR